MRKADWDLVNLGVCIKGQADALGIEHKGVPSEGVVVRIRNAAEAFRDDRDALATALAQLRDALNRDNLDDLTKPELINLARNAAAIAGAVVAQRSTQ